MIVHLEGFESLRDGGGGEVQVEARPCLLAARQTDTPQLAPLVLLFTLCHHCIFQAVQALLSAAHMITNSMKWSKKQQTYLTKVQSKTCINA